MNDRTVVLAVVVLLGLFSMIGLGGIIWLIDGGSDANSIAVVATMTGAALGGLTALLASTRSSADQPAPVNVVNAPNDPVPVDPAP